MPIVLEAEAYFLTSFWDLRTEAFSGDSSIGRIPWSACRRYGIEELGFEQGMLRIFWKVIRSIDEGFLANQREEYQRHIRANRPKKPAAKPGGRTTSKRVPKGRS